MCSNAVPAALIKRCLHLVPLCNSLLVLSLHSVVTISQTEILLVTKGDEQLVQHVDIQIMLQRCNTQIWSNVCAYHAERRFTQSCWAAVNKILQACIDDRGCQEQNKERKPPSEVASYATV